VVDIRAGARLATPVPLGRLKADPRFANSPLVREGRLSVVPLTDAQYAAILELAAPG
jgi:predicted RNA-binding protein with PUA-like domain